MASTPPLPALHIPQQQNPLEMYAQVQGIQQNQLRQQQEKLAIQQQQMAVQDQKTVRDLFVQRNGKIDDDFIREAGKRGVSPQMLQGLQLHSLDMQQKTMAVVASQGAQAVQQADLMSGAANAVKDTKPELRPQMWAQQLAGLQQAGVDVSKIPQQYPGDDMFEVYLAGIKGHKAQLEEAFKQSETAKNTAQAGEAGAKTEGAQAQLPGQVAESQIKQAEAAQMQQGGMTNAMADMKYRFIQQKKAAGAALSQDEQAFSSAYEKQKTLNTVTKIQMNQGKTSDARSDRSYQFHSAQLDKMGQPIDSAIQRMGRLQDTIGQGTPQADALIAPELLTVMAGGAGSGLRMNEAEIQRIVGGRSAWQNLQASIQHWSSDPASANSITPAQRQQIKALVTEVNRKLVAKQQILDSARQDMINASDPIEHRRIVADARSKVSAIDQGASQPAANLPKGNGGAIDKATAQQFYKAAGGDPAKAKQMAIDAGWKVQ